LKNEVCTIYRQKACAKDQAETPDEVLYKIYARLRIWKKDVFDLCIYKPNWRKGFNYDAWTADYPDKPMFVNHPFTQTKEFLARMGLHQLQGGNAVMILPTDSLDKHDLYNCFLKDCTIREDLGFIKFKPFSRKLRISVTLLYLMQPEILERAAHMKSTPYEQNLDQEGRVLSNTIRKWGPKEKTLDEYDIVQDYLAFKSLRRIKKLYGVGSIGAIRVLSKHMDYDAFVKTHGLCSQQARK
jgi:hypothetical protein